MTAETIFKQDYAKHRQRLELKLGRSQELTRLCSQELTRRMRSDLHSILSI